MGSSRRQRSKGEGTFLEHVRNLLKDLAAEVAQVKAVVENIQSNSVSAHVYPGLHQSMFGDYGDIDLGSLAWDDWGAWQSPEMGLHQETAVTVPDGEAHVHSSNTTLAIPAMNVLDKDAILRFRDLVQGEPLEDHSLIVQEELCSKCNAEVAQCICQDIYCRVCLRSADCCSCTEPLVYGSVCSSCGCASRETLFDSSPLMDLSSTMTCEGCGHWEQISERRVGVVYLLLQGASACSLCKRVDAQELVKRCDSVCEGLYHESCMKKASAANCRHDVALHICEDCARKGRVPICGMCELEAQEASEQDARSTITGATSVVQEVMQRQSALDQFETGLGKLLDCVDAADSGQKAVPAPLRTLALTAAREAHSWFKSDPSHCTTDELQERAAHLHQLVEKIKRYIT